MKLSVIFIYDGNENNAAKTLDCVKNANSLKDKIHLIFADMSGSGEALYKACTDDYTECEYLAADADADINELLKAAFSAVTGDYFATVHSGDSFDTSLFERCINLMKKYDCSVSFGAKQFEYETITANDKLSSDKKNLSEVIDLTKTHDKFPWFLEGTLFKSNILAAVTIDPALGNDAVKMFILRVLLMNSMVCYAKGCRYTFCTPYDNEYRLFQGVYDKAWYYDSLHMFTDFARELKRSFGRIPKYIQYFLLFMIYARIDANLNNRNKHVLDEEEAMAYMSDVAALLKQLDDEVILNVDAAEMCRYSAELKFLLVRIKNDFDDSHEQLIQGSGTLYMAYSGVVLARTDDMRVNILFMNYVDGMLEIDATFPDIYPKTSCKLIARLDDKDIMPVYNQRYTITKIFGCSAYKLRSFHLSIPLDDEEDIYRLSFALKYNGKYYNIAPEYKSHTSRISGKLVWMYWPMTSKYILFHSKGAIWIKRSGKGERFYRQMRMFLQLIEGHSKLDLRALFGRLAYWVTRPIYRKKKIWMFFDKIYKGGDSSEYLFRYSSKMDDGITKYYLIDKNATDYKRIKADGFKPLVRGSLKHRLVFFNAQMMIVSNSTVFAFNDLTMQGSSYFRDICDFHVVCVQHGLSVQKIAIAQNRLRDNTRLYFCASPVEIENLSRPVYDYVGYDALKLTGVPRYDGLKNDDKKQIMISPTWRMQSAMLVSKNEGVARDYNEHFKDTSYFKVFNSLINDKRLLDAADKYGYRIKFVLHPIVSPQVDDFDKNDRVDIIPAIGDMSYEKMFCESSLMVTDFSGIQFDFAYMRKPLVYLHHNDIPQHYEEGAYHYDTMAFGEIVHTNDELIDKLTEYMSTGCVMKDKYRKRADDFYAFDDHNNCKRIYTEMIKYQTNVIDANRK